MRIRRLPLAGGLFSLMVVSSAVSPALGAGFAIDPDPRSPTLGEMVDREESARRPLVAPPVRNVRTVPVIPRDAVTVWAPGVKPRSGAR